MSFVLLGYSVTVSTQHFDCCSPGSNPGSPAERAEWDYKTAVGVAQALAESKVSWVPSVMFGGGSSSNSAMDAVGLKMLLDITKSLEKTSK